MADESADELSTIIREIQDRVRARHPHGAAAAGGEIPLADLMPLLHARDAAEAKVASIGSVNPRPPGLKNSIGQALKRIVARALDWHVREQVEFNRGVIACVQATLEALTAQNRALALAVNEQSRALALAVNEQNRALERLSAEQSRALEQVVAQFSEQDNRLQDLIHALGEENLRRSSEITALAAETASLQELRGTAVRLEDEARQLRDIRAHWAHWRQEWEAKLSHNEIVFLRNLAESHSAFQHRVTLLEEAYRDLAKTQHSDFTKALALASQEIQKQVRHLRTEVDSVIHRELRTLRQRGVAPAVVSAAPAGEEAPPAPGIDWLAFSERFRGSEDYVRAKQRMYAERFAGCRNVLDLGCGRGELLEVFHDAGIPARGIDANGECIAVCKDKGLRAEAADMFAFLARGGEPFDGIVSAQVVEHLPPLRLPELVRLASERLSPGGLLGVETPNPECLAILATHFWLDPTHTRPVPAALLSFWMEEAGLGGIEVAPLNPASESIPALNSLPEEVRDALFGGMDYAIFGRKL
ncbi:MAG: methyltransferase domain-containing protein [Bryobacteraceae bacterium]|jgi:O-antigen chain-terminating methyltransferase